MNAIDTNILIWGIRRQADPTRPDMVERCSKLIADLQDRHITICVPSVVMAEYLMGHSSADQKREIGIIGRNFFVPPFDVGAAAICAELFDKATFDAVREMGVPRQCLKTDFQIVATAIAARANRIYTDNVEEFKRIANGRIIVSPVPELVDYTRKPILDGEPATSESSGTRTRRQSTFPGLGDEEE